MLLSHNNLLQPALSGGQANQLIKACPEQAADFTMVYAARAGSISWLKLRQEGANPYCAELYWPFL